MEQGKRIAACGENINDGKRQKLSAEELLRESVAMLRSSEFTQEVRLDQFAFLPNKVINDIVAIAADNSGADAGRKHQAKLATLSGPWSDFAKNNTKVLLHSNGLFLQSSESMDTALSLDEAEARNQFIGFCAINKNSNFDLFKQVAPKLYQSVVITYSPAVPNDVFELLGDRFSSVSFVPEFSCNTQTTNAKAIEFLKRQLRSQWLRSLSVSSVDLREQEIHDLLVEFVHKPTFELLCSEDCDYISPEIFIEADNAWQAKNRFDIDHQQVEGRFTGRTAKQLKEYFGILPRKRIEHSIEKHSIQTSAKRTVTMQWERATSISFKLEFCSVEREM